jgi:flagellar biosynthesis GTPase FlhF
VTAPTLTEALQRARELHGDNVCVIDSRTVSVRQEEGLGQRRMVEVRVAPPGADGRGPSRRPPRRSPAPGSDLADALVHEVERIERLAATLAGGGPQGGDWGDYPLARTLLQAGASTAAVERTAASFARLPEAKRRGRDAAVRHLGSRLRASSSEWPQLGGVHVFLGEAGCGRSDLVLGVAARLAVAGQRPLVLSLLPRHGGEIRRLQLEAAAHGYDAAVMHRPDQFARHVDQFGAYGAVLVDTPALLAAPLLAVGELQAFVVGNASFHRHLVLAADADLRERADLWQTARDWSCDWTAVTRLDRTRLPGKLLDICTLLPWPISFTAASPWPGSGPEMARSDLLVRRLLGDTEGLAAAAARE